MEMLYLVSSHKKVYQNVWMGVLYLSVVSVVGKNDDYVDVILLKARTRILALLGNLKRAQKLILTFLPIEEMAELLP